MNKIYKGMLILGTVFFLGGNSTSSFAAEMPWDEDHITSWEIPVRNTCNDECEIDTDGDGNTDSCSQECNNSSSAE